MMTRLMDRTTSDLLVLMIAGTICASVLGSSAFLIISGIANPDAQHNAAVAVVSDTIQMLVSLLAGFIAGRTEATTVRRAREKEVDEIP